MSAPQKDWNERFERAQAKPRHWRIALGVVIIALKLIQIGTSGLPANMGDTAAWLGALTGDAVLFAVAAWLIYTGRKPAKVRIPKD